MMNRDIIRFITVTFSLCFVGFSGIYAGDDVAKVATTSTSSKPADATVKKDEKGVRTPATADEKITAATKIASKLKKSAQKAKSKVASKKSKVKKSKVKKSKSKKSAKSKKKSRSRRRSTHVARLGRFKANGDIESFMGARNRLVSYFTTQMKPGVTKAEQYDAYKSVLTMVKMTGRPKFHTDAHYEATKVVLESAIANKDKFKVTAIKRGLENQKLQFLKEKGSSTLREIKKLKFEEKSRARKAKRSAKKGSKRSKPASYKAKKDRSPDEQATIEKERKERKAKKKETKAKRVEKAKAKGKSKGKSKAKKQKPADYKAKKDRSPEEQAKIDKERKERKDKKKEAKAKRVGKAKAKGKSGSKGKKGGSSKPKSKKKATEEQADKETVKKESVAEAAK